MNISYRIKEIVDYPDQSAVLIVYNRIKTGKGNDVIVCTEEEHYIVTDLKTGKDCKDIVAAIKAYKEAEDKIATYSRFIILNAEPVLSLTVKKEK